MASMEILSALTVLKLKEKCRELGLPVGGKKADLITRIQNKLSDSNGAARSTPAGPNKPEAMHTKSTIKRKPSLETLPRTTGKDVSGAKKKRTSKNDVGVANNTPTNLPAPEITPKIAPALVLMPASAASNAQKAALPNLWEGNIQHGLNTVGTPKEASSVPVTVARVMPSAQPKGSRISNSITGHSMGSTSRRKVMSSYNHNKVTDQLRDNHYQPENNRDQPSRGALYTTPVDINPIVPGEIKNTSTLKTRNLLTVTSKRKGNVALPVHSGVSISRSSVDTLGLAKADGHKSPELSTSTSSSARYYENGNVEIGASVGTIERTDSLNKKNSQLGIGDLENNAVTKPFARGFKGLKLDIGSKLIDLNKDSVPSSSSAAVPIPAVRKHDNEIPASIIRNPPLYSFRREVERTAQVLALVAFHSCSFENSMVPGHLLQYLALISRRYRYASTLAFINLVKMEFHGKRTQNWFKNKRIDEKVADVRQWYWHRVSEGASVIKRIRTSWMERVWRFLVLALESSRPSMRGTSKPVKFGLWFNGINQHLITDPDLIGQFEISVRFWIRRFYVWVSRNGGGYPLLLQDLRSGMVQDVQPLIEPENQDLWRIETKCGSVHFIIGLTGEVIGQVQANGPMGSGLNPVLRRARTRIDTIVGPGISRRYSQVGEQDHTDTGSVSWTNLREDWKEYASTLVSSSNNSSQRIIKSVYRPDSKTVSHGIHESIKLPHHRALAERWVLAQVEPGGISGNPILEASHGFTRRREKLGLDLQAKFTVESVRCSGEKWISSMDGVLAQGVGFVYTPGMGWFVLEETGQNIAQEEYGIQGLWATILGVNENGTALSAKALEGLAEMFDMN